MKVGDLYKPARPPIRWIRPRAVILGVFEGASVGAGPVREKSGTFREARDKPFCVPEGLTSHAMELIVKMKMGEDLAVFPQDRDLSAVSYVVAVIADKFPCGTAK